MKLYPNKIAELISYISNNKIKGLLLYGPDKGYIDKICQLLIQKFDFSTTTIRDAKLDYAEFGMLLNTKNFFNKRELIKLIVTTTIFNKNYKSILLSEFIHFPVFIIDELPTNAEIRKFFELENSLASIACYYFDQNNVSNLIRNKLTQANKKIDRDALEYLTLHLQGDYQLINNELEKLLCFAHDRMLLTIADVQKVITIDSTANGDSLCVSVISKNLTGFFTELEKLQLQNINEILIIRALIRYYLNLYIVLSYIASGVSLDVACKKLSPPIFYKHIDSFKKFANTITMTDILHALSVLQKAELEYKSTNGNFDFYQQVYYNIHSAIRDSHEY